MPANEQLLSPHPPAAVPLPADAETPNPEAIGPEFVSLGAASAAVQQGLGAAQVLLARCSQRLQLHQQAGGLM